MDRGTKLFLLTWAAVVLFVEGWLSARVFWLLVVIFSASALVAWFDRRIVAVVLVFSYIFPVIIKEVGGRGFSALPNLFWMAGLLGVITPDALRRSWSLPERWRRALVCWAVVVAVGAPIVALREIDFYPAFLVPGGVPEFSGGRIPVIIVLWVLQVALALVLGVLWFDWLFGATDLDLHKWIVTPLVCSFVVMSGVAVYQLFGDVLFLNRTVFGFLGRAGGTVLDANVCGTLAALWGGGILLFSDRLGRWRVYVTVSGLALGWLAVWAAGSRTGFSALVIATGFGLYAWTQGQSRRVRLGLALAVVTGVGLGLVVLATSDLTVVGPLRRVWGTLPGFSAASFRDFGFEMWNRNGWGRAAVGMIRSSPLVGIGVGSFHHFAADYGMPPDNAQNWFRHQLSELGLIGSLGWMVWAASFGKFVLTRRQSEPRTAMAARGMLIALTFISLLGMPAQDVSVAITFWTIAFCYCSYVGFPTEKVSAGNVRWAAVALVVVSYAAGLTYLSRGPLRAPMRAQRVDRPYSYGFYPPEPDTSGANYRWAARRAAAAIEAPTRWMSLSVGVNHLDIQSRPVDAKVWLDGRLVIDERIESIAPITKNFEIPAGEKRVVLETWVSRVVHPRDFGVADARELGLLVQWNFLNEPVTPQVRRGELTRRHRAQ
jgi:hypothetical protein